MHEKEIETINRADIEIDETINNSAREIVVEKLIGRIDESHKRGKSYKSIAEAAGVTERYLSHFRDGEYSDPHLSVVIGLKNALNINSFDELFRL